MRRSSVATTNDSNKEQKPNECPSDTKPILHSEPQESESSQNEQRKSKDTRSRYEIPSYQQAKCEKSGVRKMRKGSVAQMANTNDDKCIVQIY